MGRPKEHGEATREALLERAGQLLEEHGPDALSVRRLAAEAGTSTRAIYALFGGKEGLLSAMYREMAQTLTQAHEAVPEDADVSRELVRLCLAYRDSVLRHPSLYPLIVKGLPGFAPSAEDEALARRGLSRVVGTCQRGLVSAHFCGRTAEDMGFQLWALVHGLSSVELKGALGKNRRAKRIWEDAACSLVRGFEEPPRKWS